jgi:LacI family transcriptional regulator
VIAYNDLLALGFMRAAIRADVRIPAQVSVVGFDDIPDAVAARPRLTTIASPLSSLASAAVSHLLKSGITSTRRDVSVVLPARLVIRESTGPVPTAAVMAGGPQRLPPRKRHVVLTDQPRPSLPEAVYLEGIRGSLS